jgi:hypothetical protein
MILPDKGWEWIKEKIESLEGPGVILFNSLLRLPCSSTLYLKKGILRTFEIPVLLLDGGLREGVGTTERKIETFIEMIRDRG